MKLHIRFWLSVIFLLFAWSGATMEARPCPLAESHKCEFLWQEPRLLIRHLHDVHPRHRLCQYGGWPDSNGRGGCTFAYDEDTLDGMQDHVDSVHSELKQYYPMKFEKSKKVKHNHNSSAGETSDHPPKITSMSIDNLVQQNCQSNTEQNPFVFSFDGSEPTLNSEAPQVSNNFFVKRTKRNRVNEGYVCKCGKTYKRKHYYNRHLLDCKINK